MPIIIKEIHVNTEIQKKVILPGEISEQLYNSLREQVVEELSDRNRNAYSDNGRGKKER
ncbi:MAG: hypothetical protein LKF48_04930 [Prevotella sp.]|jgi:hypothetical protein|nr:hypothetical protein [Prevotella sp.]MCH4182498.1 hypothetical protein [Prevotella sp.]MCH4211632.1 hypothetical protein [Prevotella sp.]MCH4240860.1 hypothetical protein [Prevotella sp.]